MIKSLLQSIDSAVLSPCYNQYPKLLAREIGADCKTLLDVGCGSNSPLSLCSHNLEFTVGVDGHNGSIQESRLKQIHSEYRLMNILDLDKAFSASSFDCVLASDVVEHLAKPDGIRLLQMMERIARRKVIVFTPNGFLPQEADDNPFQKHLCGWSVEELKQRGYNVIGIHGWKPLRTSYNRVKFKPVKLWERLSLVSQAFCESLPDHAFQLLCVKQISSRSSNELTFSGSARSTLSGITRPSGQPACCSKHKDG